MRIAPVFLILSLFLSACHATKQLEKIQPANPKVDTSTAEVVIENKQRNAIPVEDVFKKVVRNHITYITFNARVKVQYESKESSDDATAFIRVRRDSAVWISLRGALGIEGARVLITRDSVKVMNMFRKNVQNRPISFLEELTGLPLDLSTLQDVIVGNPVFIDTNILSRQVNANNELVVLMAGRVFKNLLTLDSADLKIIHSRLEQAGKDGIQTCDITFSNYEKGDILFSRLRKISVVQQSKMEVNLDFRQYSFNNTVTFPFNIPTNYKRLL